MSRSGYSDDIDDDLQLGRWRGQVASAIRGKRGQAFLLSLVASLDAMPEKKLIRDAGRTHEGVCALGSIDLVRGADLEELDRMMRNEDYDGLGERFGVAPQLAQEVMYMNDDAGWGNSPEQRWSRMRSWALDNLRPETLVPETEAQEGQ